MKKALVAVLALALAAGGVAAANEKGFTVGAGYGNNSMTFADSSDKFTYSINAIEIGFGGYLQLGNGPIYLMGDLGYAYPLAIDYISGGTTTTFSISDTSYVMNGLFGIQYTLGAGSPFSFNIGVGPALNASTLNGGNVMLLALGAGGKASVKYMFSKHIGLALGVREAYYFLPVLAVIGKYDVTKYFSSANNISGSLAVAISF
jgi:hypothetical protein